jgi:hypothetical protein
MRTIMSAASPWYGLGTSPSPGAWEQGVGTDVTTGFLGWLEDLTLSCSNYWGRKEQKIHQEDFSEIS